MTIGNAGPADARERLLANLAAGNEAEVGWTADTGRFPRWFSETVELLVRTARGERVDLSEIPIRYPEATPLRRRIWETTRRIGWGETLTYGQLAEKAGVPRGARTVGQAMANNVLPIVVPCHRVVGAGDKLTGFSAPRGLHLKRELLEQEGVTRLGEAGK